MKLRSDFSLGKIKIKNFINLNEEEKEIVRKWRNNKDIRKFMYQKRIITKKEHIKFIESLKSDSKNFYWFVINEKNYLGVFYLNKVDLLNKHAYLGIYSNPELKGVGRILMKCLMYIAFKVAKLHTLKLEVIETNKNAIEFYKKHGFQEEGRLKEFVFRDGKWLDVIVMGRINENV